MAKNTCPGCASSNPADFDDSNGTLVCTNCGTVLQDSQIVSEITFGETSSGAAMVQGSYVAEGQTHVGGGGKFRSGTSLESRDAAIMHGKSDHGFFLPLFCSVLRRSCLEVDFLLLRPLALFDLAPPS